MRGLFSTAVISMALFLTPIGSAGAEENACSNVSKKMSAEYAAINAKYDKPIAQLSKDMNEKSKSIRDKSPRKSNATAAIDLDFDIKMKDAVIILNLPEIKIVDTRLSFDLPEIASVPTKVSWDKPTPVLGSQCRGGPDEIVCSNANGIPYDCRTRRGPDICFTTTLRIENRREELSFDLPSVTMKRSDIVVGVPEFAMRTQRLVFGIPEFTLRRVSVQSKEAKREGDELNKEAKRRSQSIADGMKADYAIVSTRYSAPLAECVEKQISSSLEKTDASINTSIRRLQDARTKLPAGSASAAARIDASISKLERLKTVISQQASAKRNSIVDALVRRQKVQMASKRKGT